MEFAFEKYSGKKIMPPLIMIPPDILNPSVSSSRFALNAPPSTRL